MTAARHIAGQTAISIALLGSIVTPIGLRAALARLRAA